MCVNSEGVNYRKVSISHIEIICTYVCVHNMFNHSMISLSGHGNRKFNNMAYFPLFIYGLVKIEYDSPLRNTKYFKKEQHNKMQTNRKGKYYGHGITME